MKNFPLLTILVVLFSFLFSSCEDKDDDVTTDNCPELAFESIRENTHTYLFEADFRAKDSITYGWYIDGALVEREGSNVENSDHKLLWQFDEGTYEVCIKTETPECPEGTSFCRELVIDPKNDKCPEMAFRRDGDYLFADFEGIDRLQWYGWFIDDKLVEDEGILNNGDNKLRLGDLEPGVYEICIMTETPECPRGTFFCKEIKIEERPCAELSFSRDGAYLYADYKGAPNDAQYTWFVDGEEVSPNATSRKFPIDKIGTGTHRVCVVTRIEGCDEPVEYCQEVIIEDQTDTCPTMTINIDGDLYADFKGATPNTIFRWFIDNIEIDQFPNASSESRRFPLDKIQAGTYKVCVTATSAECNREIEFCKEITIQ